MYRVLLAVLPIDLCHAINVSSERNPRRGHVGESRAGSAWKIHAPQETTASFAKSRRNERPENQNAREYPGWRDRERSCRSIERERQWIPSFLLDEARKIERREKKAAEKSGRSHQSDGSSGRHTSFKATFRSTHLESGTCRDRRQIEWLLRVENGVDKPERVRDARAYLRDSPWRTCSCRSSACWCPS